MDAGDWYAQRSREAGEAWAEIQAARERHRRAVQAGDSPLLVRQLEDDVWRAQQRYERAAYVGD